MRRGLLIAGGVALVLTLIVIGIGIGVGLYLGSSDGTKPLQNGTETEPGNVAMVVRKQSENPEDFFNKDFKEYQDGFEANGESWIGLDKLHQLTSQRSYSLKISMKDYDGREYVAVYDRFKVGPGDDYVAEVESFNATLSTLGDSLIDGHNGHTIDGMKFSTKDRDQDIYDGNCAERFNGGWWYDRCHTAHPTGLSSATKQDGFNGAYYVSYYSGGERGNTYSSWSEAEYLLVPN